MRTTEKTIDGFTYRVRMLPAGEGFKLAAELTKRLLPAGGELASSGIATSDAPALASTFRAIAERIDPDWMLSTAKLFAKHTEVELPDGKVPQLKDVFDDHFAGEYGRMVDWLVFCLEANFADLLKKFKGVASRAFSAPSNVQSPS